MNVIHHWLCASSKWRRTLERDILPWTLQDVPLGTDLLEFGPGPGLTTELLQHRTARLTALELDSELAKSLSARFRGTNVRVIRADATETPFADRTFSAVAAFTMLHHLPTPEAQDQLFREAYRVLRPGAVFVGTDSRDGLTMRLLHIRDTLVPLDPRTLAARLRRCGFKNVRVDLNSRRLRFEAYR